MPQAPAAQGPCFLPVPCQPFPSHQSQKDTELRACSHCVPGRTSQSVPCLPALGVLRECNGGPSIHALAWGWASSCKPLSNLEPQQHKVSSRGTATVCRGAFSQSKAKQRGRGGRIGVGRRWGEWGGLSSIGPGPPQRTGSRLKAAHDPEPSESRESPSSILASRACSLLRKPALWYSRELGFLTA